MDCTLKKMMVDVATTVVVESPYYDNTLLFDNPESSDMEFMVQGMEKPLKLHRVIMSTASNFVRRMLTQQGGNENSRGWVYDMSRNVDKKAMVKVIRFCYGEDMEIGVDNGECCAIIAALYRLEVTCTEEIVKRIGYFGLEEAKKDLRVGVKLLKECVAYPECCTEHGCGLDMALSQIVLTADNVRNNYETVVDDCLMMLPPRYLDVVGYGSPHTKLSDFHIRFGYVIRNANFLTTEMKEMIMKRCNMNDMRCEELKALRQVGALKLNDLLDAFQFALEKMEKIVDELKKRGITIETGIQNEESEFIQHICCFVFCSCFCILMTDKKALEEFAFSCFHKKTHMHVTQRPS